MREVLANHLRRSKESRLALRLYLKYGYGGPTILVLAAERKDAGRFIVHAEEKLTAFVELEAAILARGQGDGARRAGEIFPKKVPRRDIKP